MAKDKKHAHIKRTTGGETSPFRTLWDGIGNLIDIVADMDEKGVDEFVRKRTVEGKTASGKDVRGEYGLRVRTGLDVLREKEKGEDTKDKKDEK